ncbi:hypothetical protein MFIFM68171_00180 [Madurella fahalii]|uniref:DUF1917-domain-containing protein n=1 Tax=Madurella fahalii TaxID=1157608 RepID=A0ABQ0FWU4_9PEZI
MPSPATSAQDIEPPGLSAVDDEPRDPYADTRNPAEAVPEFLARLPPVPADGNPPVSYWYSVYPDCHGPDTPVDAPDIAQAIRFRRAGRRLLQRYKLARDSNSRNEPLCARQREELTRDIGRLARENGIAEGKWMLFPTIDTVTEVWRAVAEAVVAGRLGVGAKVATAGLEGDENARVICMYTKDFTDVEDVKRVLLALDEMGLVKAAAGRASHIMYNCDAYTCLDIYKGNEYQLPVSIYKRSDMFPERRSPSASERGRAHVLKELLQRGQ